MGTAESSQSSEMGATAGLNNQSSFHRQSPNVARLIRSENSSKMEYEFPISEASTNSSLHHHHHHRHHHHGDGGGTSNHSIIPGNNNNRHGHSSSHHSNSSNSPQQINTSGHILGNYDNLRRRKLHSSQTSNIWLSLTSCFGCRTRSSDSSSMNSLRDKVHAIRIVRASNDLTPAVFDSHYNIITLEQLRECDNTASGNINSLPNDLSDPLPSQNSDSYAPAQNGNGSVPASSSVEPSSSSSKKDNNHRMRKKKKKRAAAATTAYSSKTTYSDDDDEGSERT
ncbi:unnamed protein product [Rotaria sp. Silwood2]|nr:unnamed protein product [Rotaria sp. Silwood2]CAF4430230.1 unnamed protein product [Rotaria sp. Silwood2]CAF4463061.1 unnamed protein product [Rotaria sp. Silwood2]CAF4513736.1 unnamed protein product [Rotaria sp. Silwood2]